MGSVARKEDNLAAAGFVQRPANTAGRQAMLARLPALKFVRRVHGKQVNYVFADPTSCDCLFVGNQQAYGRYHASSSGRTWRMRMRLPRRNPIVLREIGAPGASSVLDLGIDRVSAGDSLDFFLRPRSLEGGDIGMVTSPKW